MRISCLSLVVLLAAACSNTHCRRKSEVGTVVNPVAAEAPATKSNGDSRIFIYKYDGSQQCKGNTGISLEKMSEELKGIPILSQKKKKDGLMHIQVCGSPTGTANVYEISEKNLEKAEKAGFKKWNFE